MNSCTLQLDRDSAAYQPGELITGSLLWETSQGTLDVRLYWQTSGKGTQDLGIVEAIEIDASPERGSASIQLTAPSAPWSCSGRLVSISWMLEVAQGRDALCSTELIIAPGAREVQLQASE